MVLAMHDRLPGKVLVQRGRLDPEFLARRPHGQCRGPVPLKKDACRGDDLLVKGDGPFLPTRMSDFH
jgi:hypothetical protein